MKTVLRFGRIFGLVYFDFGRRKNSWKLLTFLWAIPFLVCFSALIYYVFVIIKQVHHENANTMIRTEVLICQSVAISSIYIKFICFFLKRNEIRLILTRINKIFLFIFLPFLTNFFEAGFLLIYIPLNYFKYYFLLNVSFYVNCIEQIMIKQMADEIKRELSVVNRKLRKLQPIFADELNQRLRKYTFLRNIWPSVESHMKLCKIMKRSADTFSIPIITTLVVNLFMMIGSLHYVVSMLHKQPYSSVITMTICNVFASILQIIYVITQWTAMNFQVS